MQQMTSSKLAVAAALFAAVALSSLSTAPRADAATGVKYGLTDDAWLLHGQGSLESRLNKLDALGPGASRSTWRGAETAASRPAPPGDPADAAYHWTAP